MLADIVKAVLPLAERFIPDKGQAAQFAHEIAKAQMQGDFNLAQGQLEVNKVEAAHRSPYVAGWRPFIGYVCGSAFAANYVFLPIWKALAPIWDLPVDFQPFDLSVMLPVMLGMLGLGGYRSWEKGKGLSR